MYGVQYIDGHKVELAENLITENMFSQVDSEGKGYVLFEAILDNQNDGS